MPPAEVQCMTTASPTTLESPCHCHIIDVVLYLLVYGRLAAANTIVAAVRRVTVPIRLTLRLHAHTNARGAYLILVHTALVRIRIVIAVLL